jgi:hypothetical protein
LSNDIQQVNHKQTEKLKNRSMKKFATAFVNLFDNEQQAKVVEALDEIDAMKKVIIDYMNDKHVKEWLSVMDEMSIDEFKDEASNAEILVDAVAI